MHDRAYTRGRCEWGAAKAAANLRFHGVDFADAALVLQDLLARTVPDPDAAGEERYVTIGCDVLGRLLVVVWTPRAGRVRLISARRATKRERHSYEEG